MATQTTNYGLTKPAWDEKVDVTVLNDNSDIIDAQMHANETMAAQSVANMADAYDATATYAEGDYCTYGGKLYQANTDISVAEAFDATHWDETTAAEHFSDGGGGGGGGGVHYSTTEQVIGTWIDGSTLYQRTFELNNLSGQSYIFGLDSYGVDFVAKVECLIRLGEAGAYQWITSPYIESSSYRADCHWEEGNNQIQIKSNWDLTAAIVTVQYTKITS